MLRDAESGRGNVSAALITLLVLASIAGLVVYALIATVAVREIGKRMTFSMEPVGWLAGALWPIGLPLLLGVWLGIRATRTP